MRLRGVGLSLLWSALEYSTHRDLVVRSPWVGGLYRLSQLSVLSFVLGYSILYRKGYQVQDDVEFACTIKVKGVASTLRRSELPHEYRGVWDPSDYLLATHHNEAFFLTTNAIITNRQSPGTCPEKMEEAGCSMDSDCGNGTRLTSGNGVFTGRCDQAASRCQVEAWCPVEDDDLLKFPRPQLEHRPLLEDAENFTVFLETFVTFPLFNLRTSNLRPGTDLSKCRNDRVVDPYCPIFRIGDIVSDALRDKQNGSFKDFATLGGVIKIIVAWDCDLDRQDGEDCLPKYSFRRLGTVGSLRGWSFRTAHEYRLPELNRHRLPRLYRDVIKNYGILFLVSVQGTAAKFSWLPTLLRVGSGLGLLTLCRVLVDMVSLYALPNRRLLRRRKFEKLRLFRVNVPDKAGREEVQSNRTSLLSPIPPERDPNPFLLLPGKPTKAFV